MKKEVEANHFKLLPSLFPKFFPGDFFVNSYGNKEPLRFGCKYSSSNIQSSRRSEEYFVIVELFEKIPDIDFFDSEIMGNETLYYGYLTDFQLGKNFVEQNLNFITIAQGTKLITIFNLKKQYESSQSEDFPELYCFTDSKKDNKLKEFLRLFLKSKVSMPEFPIFGLLKYFPVESNKWRLVTVIFYYVYEELPDANQLIPALQGNYEANGGYLNLSIKFFYKDNRFIVEKQLGELNKFGNYEIYVKEIKPYLIITHSNEKEKYIVESKNNETTKGIEKYIEDIKNLVFDTLKLLENYNCEKETISAAKISSRIMSSLEKTK